MRSTFVLTLVLALLLALGTGCISNLSVEKVEPGERAKGLVYSLPKTYLVVKPKPDGTMDVRFAFLPDPENTYAISASSLFSKHTLAVTLTQAGLLQELDWKPDGTGVAAKLVEAAGKVYAAERAEDAEKEATDKKAREDAKKKVTDAEAAVKAARRTLETRRSELAALELQLAQVRGRPNPPPEAIEALELAIFKKQEDIRFAEEDLAAAEAALTEATGAAGALGNEAAGSEEYNVAGASTAEADEGFPKSWGGILYEVVEEYDWRDFGPPEACKGIAARPRLRAVRTGERAQVDFSTQKAPPLKVVTPKVTLEIEGGPEFLLPDSRPAVVAAWNKRDLAQRKLATLEESRVPDDQKLQAKLGVLEAEVAFDHALAAEAKNGLVVAVRSSALVKKFVSAKLVVGDDKVSLDVVQLSDTRLLALLPQDTARGAYSLEVDFLLLDPKSSKGVPQDPITLPLLVR